MLDAAFATAPLPSPSYSGSAIAAAALSDLRFLPPEPRPEPRPLPFGVPLAGGGVNTPRCWSTFRVLEVHTSRRRNLGISLRHFQDSCGGLQVMPVSQGASCRPQSDARAACGCQFLSAKGWENAPIRHAHRFNSTLLFLVSARDRPTR